MTTLGAVWDKWVLRDTIINAAKRKYLVNTCYSMFNVQISNKKTSIRIRKLLEIYVWVVRSAQCATKLKNWYAAKFLLELME